MKPHVICLMLSSLDGRLATRRWSKSPDGLRSDWVSIYNNAHNALDSDAWIVGRVTMGEMTAGAPHPPAPVPSVARPLHKAVKTSAFYAIALDPNGKLHFQGNTVDGDNVIVLLGTSVPDSHLAELTAEGISYIVAETAQIDLCSMLDVLGHEFGIKRLLLEGGGLINGSFLAAGLVDEIRVMLAPAVDGREFARAIIDHHGEGLADKVQLSLISATTLDHGIVDLRYAVHAATRDD